MPADWVEKNVTVPIEKGLYPLNGISDVESLSKTGLSVLQLTLNKPTFDVELRLRLRQVLKQTPLPKEAEKPILAQYRHTDQPVLIFSLYKNQHESTGSLAKRAQELIKPKLMSLKGVANVEISGAQEKMRYVDVSTQYLQASGRSIEQVISQISRNNIAVTAENSVRAEYRLDNRREIEKLILTAASPVQAVSLTKMASVYEGVPPCRNLTRINSRNALTLYVQKETGANVLKVCQAVRNVLGKEKAVIIFDQSLEIKKALKQLILAFLFGVLLLCGVLALFLKNRKLTGIVFKSFLICLGLSLGAMYLLGISLNCLSLTGLAVSLGLIADNFIIIIEKSFQKVSPLKAVKAVLPVIISSTATTLIVFIPLLFISSSFNLPYKDLAYTMIVMLLCSLIVSLVFIPAELAVLLSKKESLDQRLWQKMERGYQALLCRFIKFKKIMFIGLALAGGLAVYQASQLKWVLDFPWPKREPTLHVQLPDGTKTEKSIEIVSRIEKMLKKLNNIELVHTKIEGWSSKIEIHLKRSSHKEIKNLVSEIRKQIAQAKFSNAFIYFSGLEKAGGSEFEIEVSGQNRPDMRKTALEISRYLRQFRQIKELKLKSETYRPEIHLNLNQELLHFAGWNPGKAADSLHAVLQGVEATRDYQNEKVLKTIVRGKKGEIDQLEEIYDLTLFDLHSVPLSMASAADIGRVKGVSQVWRKNGKRVLVLSGQVPTLQMDRLLKEIKNQSSEWKKLDGIDVKVAVHYFQRRAQFIKSLLMLGFSLVLIYLVLGIILNSYFKPFFILLAIPLGWIGVPFLLCLLHIPVSFGVVTGLMILGGIAVNHIILYLEGEHCFRPICMTTLTTLIGLLPIALQREASAVIGAPAAWTLIGGIACSALLTLLFVPMLFTMKQPFTQ